MESFSGSFYHLGTAQAVSLLSGAHIKQTGHLEVRTSCQLGIVVQALKEKDVGKGPGRTGTGFLGPAVPGKRLATHKGLVTSRAKKGRVGSRWDPGALSPNTNRGGSRMYDAVYPGVPGGILLSVFAAGGWGWDGGGYLF